MKDGQKIAFHGEGDQEPGLEPGDIIIVLDKKDHAAGGEDISLCMDRHLVEALCGFQKPISTLDNHHSHHFSSRSDCQAWRHQVYAK